MADNSAAAAEVASEDELRAFHETHFSTSQVSTYAEQFLGPVEGAEHYEADDELGYYADGVKRTLTDEQIAMFRHSEIQALLRKQRHAEEAKGFENNTMDPGAEDGKLDVDEAVPPQKKEKGKKQKAKKSWYKTHVKPDLRKRTWDKVDQGLESLEYGDETASQPAAKRSMQRKQISYDD